MINRRLLVEANSIVPHKRSGIGHFTLELLRELDKDTYKGIEVIAYGCIGERRALEAHGFKRIKIMILPFPHKVLAVLSRIPIPFSLELFLGRGTYLFPNFRNLYVGKSKSLTYIHDVSFMLYPQFTEPSNLKYILSNINRWVGRTDVVLTISQQSKREIMAELGVAESKVIVTPLAVNPAVFYPRSSDEVRSVCSELGVQSGKYFLFIGNIEPRKNLEFLVRAYMCNPKLKPYSLLIVGGDGWLNESINAAINEAREAGYAIVRNQRYVPDEMLPALMTGSLGLVMPSHHEGFGLPVIQALACGASVAVSDIPVMHETAGASAYYFNPSSSDELNDTLEKIIASKRLKTVTQRSWDEVCASLVHIITTSE